MSTNDYYPMGTWGGDPRAPWNQPDPEDVEQYGESWDDSDCGWPEVRQRVNRILLLGRIADSIHKEESNA